jgi:hypothetical protein
MIRIVLRYLLSGIPAPPAPSNYAWATLSVLLFSLVNLVFQTELWPDMPAVPRQLEIVTGLAVLIAWPQALWWGWQWLQVYAGPEWLRRLASVGYIGGALLGLLLWLFGAVSWVMEVSSRYF